MSKTILFAGATGVTVTWHYYINGTGAPFFYYDGLNVRL